VAEILVMARDNVSSDPIKNSQLYKRGQVVCVQPDGHPWAAGELDTSVFNIIKLPGVPVEDLRDLCETKMVTQYDTVTGKSQVVMKNRRKVKLNFSKLPAKAKEAIQQKAIPAITKGQLNAAKVAVETMMSDKKE